VRPATVRRPGGGGPTTATRSTRPAALFRGSFAQPNASPGGVGGVARLPHGGPFPRAGGQKPAAREAGERNICLDSGKVWAYLEEEARWAVPVGRDVRQLLGIDVVFREAGWQRPFLGRRRVKAAAHASRPPALGSSEGTSPHRSKGPPPISVRTIAGDIAPAVRAVSTYPMRLRASLDRIESSRRATRAGGAPLPRAR